MELETIFLNVYAVLCVLYMSGMMYVINMNLYFMFCRQLVKQVIVLEERQQAIW